VLFFEESSRATLGAIALLTGWELMVVARALRARRAS
jgi:hypothetical protein